MRSERTLAEMCELIADCPHKTAPTSDNAFAFAVGTRAIREGRIDFRQARPVSEDTYRAWVARGAPRPGDIILGREAPVGPVARVPREPRVCLGQRTVLLRPDARRVDPDYLLYVLLSPSAQARMAALAEGSTVAHLNVADVRRFALSVPALAEQHRIATVLGALDDKIDSNERSVKLLSELARTLALRELGDAIADDPELPALNDISDVLSGGTPRTSESRYWGGDVLWASVKDFGAVSPYIINTERKVTQDAVAETRLRIYPVNTVLISARGTVGLVALTGQEMSFNQSCFGLHGRAEVGQSTLFEIVKAAVETLRARSHGSVFSTITRSTFADVRVRLPGPEELTVLEQRLSPLHAQILSLTREAAVLAHVSRALLPKLVVHGLDLAEQAPVRVPLEPAAA